MDLFKGVTNLSVLTSTSGEGFDLTIFANADLTSENVIVISATGTGGGSPPDITFVPANPNNNDHDSYIPNPPPRRGGPIWTNFRLWKKSSSPI